MDMRNMVGAERRRNRLYVAHWIIVYPITRWLSGFRWSRENKEFGAVSLVLVGIVFAGFYVLPLWWASTLGILATLASAIHSLRTLGRLLDSNHLSRSVRWLLAVSRAVTSKFKSPGTTGKVDASGGVIQ
jgi:hypothetical protein